MTFQQKMVQMLYEHGLFEDQANAIVGRAVRAAGNESMRGRWDDDVSGYPPVMVNVVWLAVKRTALEYIDENCPQAWFRPLFAGEEVNDAPLPR